jgi:Domain of unknown function (DUF4787)
MVQVKRPTHTGSSTPPYLIFLVKILLVLLILFLLPKLVQSKKRNRAERNLRDVQHVCEHSICKDIATTTNDYLLLDAIYRYPEENVNCILVCMSPACYQAVYGEVALEAGEVDLVRGQVFFKCARDEFAMAQKRLRLYQD